MPDVLDRVLSEVRTLEADAASAYLALVARLAADEEVPAPDVLAAVEAAGRDLAALTRDVERLVSRRKAATVLSELPRRVAVKRGCERELFDVTRLAGVELAQRLAELERERRQAHVEHDNRIACAQAALDQAAADVAAAEQARAALMETAHDHLKAKAAELRDARTALAHKAGELRKAVDREDKLIASAREMRNAKDPTWRTAEEKRETIAKANRIELHAEPRRADAVKELERVREQLADIDARLADAEAALLVP